MKDNVWFWWEVEFTDRRLDKPLTKATAHAMTATVERLDLDDVDVDQATGKPVEVTSFIENTAYFVVRTLEDEPMAAVRRAISLMYPTIMSDREEVQWASTHEL